MSNSREECIATFEKLEKQLSSKDISEKKSAFLECLEMILARDFPDTEDEEEESFEAKYKSLLKKFLKNPEIANAVDANGKSALIKAIEKGDFDIASLLKSHADLNAEMKDGTTALIAAIRKMKIDSNEKMKPKERDALQRKAFAFFMKLTRDQNVLIDTPSKTFTPLGVAASLGLKEAVDELLTSGAKKETQNASGETAHMLAVRNNHKEIANLVEPKEEAKQERKVEDNSLLLEAVAPPPKLSIYGKKNLDYQPHELGIRENSTLKIKRYNPHAKLLELEETEKKVICELTKPGEYIDMLKKLNSLKSCKDNNVVWELQFKSNSKDLINNMDGNGGRLYFGFQCNNEKIQNEIITELHSVFFMQRTEGKIMTLDKNMELSGAKEFFICVDHLISVQETIKMYHETLNSPPLSDDDKNYAVYQVKRNQS